MPDKNSPSLWHHTCKASHAETYLGMAVDKCPWCGTLQKESARKKEAKRIKKEEKDASAEEDFE